MQKQITKNKKILSTISILMLFLAIPSGIWPYGYYQILRLVITGTATFFLLTSLEDKKERWAWIMGIIIIFFNPMFTVHFEKETWAVLDLITAIIFLIYLFQIKKDNK